MALEISAQSKKLILKSILKLVCHLVTIIYLGRLVPFKVQSQQDRHCTS